MVTQVDNRVEVRRAKFVGWEFRCIHEGMVVRRAPFDRESWSWRPTRFLAFCSGKLLLNAVLREDSKEKENYKKELCEISY